MSQKQFKSILIDNVFLWIPILVDHLQKTMVNVIGEIDSLCEIYTNIIEFSAESLERCTIVLCEIKKGQLNM